MAEALGLRFEFLTLAIIERQSPDAGFEHGDVKHLVDGIEDHLKRTTNELLLSAGCGVYWSRPPR
jgi:hypothetical protein